MQSEDRSWKDEVSALRAKGLVAEMLRLLQRTANTGFPEARAVLAKEYFVLGRFREANNALKKCEREVQDGDFWSHWHLYSAYFLGVGEQGFLEKLSRGVQHLELAAETSRIPQLLMEIAGYYEGGLNGVHKNLERAEEWLRKASETGNEEAVGRHKRVVSKLKRESRRLRA